MARGPGGEATALVAALLAAVSPIDVYYSQETRMYALLPVLALLSLIVTTLLLKAGTTRRWLLWVVVNVIGLYVYYYLGLVTAAEALALLGTAIRRGESRAWLLAQVATLALYAPWTILMARGLGGSALALPPATAVHLTSAQYLLENWRDFTIGFTGPPAATGLLGLFAVAAILGAIALGKRSPAIVALLLLCLAIPLAGAGAVLLVRPFFYPRFILFAAIPIWTVTAVGLTLDRRIWPLSVALLTLIVAGNGWTWYHERTTPRVGYAPDDYRVVFATLDARARPGDVVLCGYPWQAGYVQAYLWKDNLRTAFLPGQVGPEQIDRSLGPSGRAWVYEYSPDHRFAGNGLENVLSSRAETLVVDQFGDSRVQLFAPAGTTPGPAPPVQATLGPAIALLSSQIHLPTPARPGDAVQLTLRWRAMSHPAAPYTVFVHLLGPDGKVVAQHDGPPVGGAFPTDRWYVGEEIVDRYTLTIPESAKAGAYQVELGMYRPDTGQRLVVGPTPEKDNRIVIGEFSIGR